MYDGCERRANLGCQDPEIQSRVRALEVYSKGHADSLETLTSTLRETNKSLSEVVVKLTEVKTTQRNTHVFAGMLGSSLGSIAGFLGAHVFR